MAARSYLYRQIIRPRFGSYGVISTTTRSPGTIRMKFLRILPDTWARMTRPPSISTRNWVFARAWTTRPSTVIASSFFATTTLSLSRNPLRQRPRDAPALGAFRKQTGRCGNQGELTFRRERTSTVAGAVSILAPGRAKINRPPVQQMRGRPRSPAAAHPRAGPLRHARAVRYGFRAEQPAGSARPRGRLPAAKRPIPRPSLLR